MYTLTIINMDYHLQNGSKVFLDIDKRPGSPLLVTSHTDKHVRIWDNRTDCMCYHHSL